MKRVLIQFVLTFGLYTNLFACIEEDLRVQLDQFMELRDRDSKSAFPIIKAALQCFYNYVDLLEIEAPEKGSRLDQLVAEIYFQCGRAYDYGIGTETKPDTAIHYYLAASNKDHPAAMNNLANIYLGRKEYYYAREWFQRSVRLKNYSCVPYADMCWKGIGGKIDYNQAAINFKRAADESNDLGAAYRFAFICLGFEHFEKEQNVIEPITCENHLDLAREYAEKACQPPLPLPEAQYLIAVMMMNGEGYEKNPALGAQTLLGFLNVPLEKKLPLVDTPLGLMARYWLSIANLRLTLKPQDQSQELDLKGSIAEDTRMYLNQARNICKIFPRESMNPYFRRIAAETCYWYGYVLQNGIGGDMDLVVALMAYREAAELGHEESIHLVKEAEERANQESTNSVAE